MVKMIALQLFK